MDGLGSTRGLTNTDGIVTDTYTYDAFGNLIAQSGGTDNNYLFAGEQFDLNLDQYYLRQRYYNQNSGRFTRRDIYEGRKFEPFTRHDYLYGNANPVTYTDPAGLFSVGEAQAAAGIANTLAGIQWESGQNLIFATLGGREGERTPASMGGNTLLGLGLLAGIPLLGSAITLAGIKSAEGAAKVLSPIANISNQYENYKWVECAKAMKKYLKSQKIPGKHIKLETGSQTGLDSGIWDDSIGMQIADNGRHQGIAIDIGGVEMVFDNHHPNGIPKEEWLPNLVFPSKITGGREFKLDVDPF